MIKKLEWETKKVKVKDLIELDINPRKISKEKQQKLKDSLDRFNLVEIPAVNADFKIIGGNQRVAALLLSGRGEEFIDVRFPNRKLTEKEIKEYVIISNTHAGEFDFEILDLEFSDIELSDIGFDIAGLKDWNLQQEDEVLEAKEDDYTEPDNLKVDVVLGDLIEIGEHRLLCGDSTDSDQLAKLMNGKKADMVHTDPPYNIDYEGGSKKRDKIANDKLDDFPKFLYDAYVTLTTALKKGGAIYVWHASTETHNFIQQFINSGFLFKSYIVWNKNNSTFGRSDYHWKHEPCIYGWLEGASHKWFGDRKQTTVWDVDRPSRSDEHPTMKPIALCSKPLENSSKVNDIILDTFLGSGSTMVAAHQLKRKCYGMELDPKYCQVIIDRMQKLDDTLQIKINGKEYKSQNVL